MVAYLHHAALISFEFMVYVGWKFFLKLVNQYTWVCKMTTAINIVYSFEWISLKMKLNLMENE